MDLSQLGLFNGIANKMNWLVQRQAVTSENIANQNTPGYRPNDIAPFTFKNMLKKLAPVATDAQHIQTASADGEQAKESIERNLYEVKPDGNAVSTEQETKKAATTAAEYQLASNMYEKTVKFLKIAIGVSS